MPNIFDLVTAKAIGTYWTETVSNRIPYLGEALFPPKKKLGLDLSWIKGNKGLPVALKPSNFDAKASTRDRIDLTKIESEMPFFREAMAIKEKDRQELLKVQESNPQYYQTLLTQIFDDRNGLIAGALVQSERMRMQLLVNGKINITADRLAYVYDFDRDNSFNENNYLELTGTRVWSDHANAMPIADFQYAKRQASGLSGSVLTTAIMTTDTWTDLMMNQSIKMDMNVLQGQNIILTDAMLEQYFLSKLKLKVIVYDKKYKDEQGADHNFFPDGYVTLIPDGVLGNTWYGTTPEEADLMSGSTAQVNVVETGVAVTTYKEEHPVNVLTVVSEIVLPSFERMGDIFVIKTK